MEVRFMSIIKEKPYVFLILLFSFQYFSYIISKNTKGE